MLLQDYIGEKGLVKGKLVPLNNISFSLGNLLTSFFLLYNVSHSISISICICKYWYDLLSYFASLSACNVHE